MAFAAQVARFTRRADKAVEETRRAILLKLFLAIIYDTPVLTGRLRGNWQTSTGTPKSDDLERIDTHAVIEEVGSNLGEGDVDVWFVNNLPYARRVEFEGWSHTKAPAGMLRKNVERIQSVVREAIAENRT